MDLLVSSLLFNCLPDSTPATFETPTAQNEESRKAANSETDEAPTHNPEPMEKSKYYCPLYHIYIYKIY